MIKLKDLLDNDKDREIRKHVLINLLNEIPDSLYRLFVSKNSFAITPRGSFCNLYFELSIEKTAFLRCLDADIEPDETDIWRENLKAWNLKQNAKEEKGIIEHCRYSKGKWTTIYKGEI